MRCANINDLEKIYRIIEDAKKALAEDKVDQWQNGIPTFENLKNDLNLKESFVYEKNKEILAYARLMTSYEPTYKIVEEKFKDHGKSLTVHRFAVKKDVKKGGVGSKFFQEILAYAKSKSCTSVRIDTHKDNFKMRNFIKKFNFSEVGIIFTDDNGALKERIAYELIL